MEATEIKVPAPGTVQPAEIRELDTKMSGRQYDGQGQEDFARLYALSVRSLEDGRAKLTEAERYRPDYAQGPTRTETSLKAAVRTREEQARYFQIRYWLCRKGIEISKMRGR